MKRKKKLPPLSSLKLKLDTLFSKWVRLSVADTNGYCECVSCGVWHPWQEMDAGHFIPRASLATRWDERNVHPQCRHCNRFRHDHYIEYTLWMQREYGQAVIDELMSQKGLPCRVTRAEYQAFIDHYAAKLAGLAAGNVRESRWALVHCS